MSEQDRKPARLDESGMTREVRVLDDLESRVPLAPEPQSYVREPLFSKKVMIAWAAGAFIVWFGFSFIVPEIVGAIRTAIESSVEPEGSNGAVKRVITTRNGTKITIEREGVTVAAPPAPPPSTAEPEAAPAAPAGKR